MSDPTAQPSNSAPVDLPTTRDELFAWIDAIPPIPRAKLLGLLVDAQNAKALAAKRRAAVAEAAAGYGNAGAVAEELDVSVKAVYKAASEHRRATRTADDQ
ncbi:hypothetical protein [Amycolatopsis sp. NPDC004378]